MPLPWTVVRDYGVSLDLDGEDLDDFIKLIRDMDNAYLEYFRKKQEAEKQAKK